MAEQETTVAKKRVTAGWFDLRYILATLFVIYGVITVVMGADPSEEALRKAGGWNLNLWTGVVMLIVSLLFAAWAWWRPVKVDVPVEGGEQSRVDAGEQ